MVCVPRFFMSIFAFSVCAPSAVIAAHEAHVAGADYDGNEFAEIPVLSMPINGSFDWQLFNPVSGATTRFTTGLDLMAMMPERTIVNK